MLSRYIMLPIGIAASILGALAFYYDNAYAAVIATLLIIAMIGVYFFSDVIDWGWYQKHLPKMDDRMIGLLEKRLPFYQGLNDDDKVKFQGRIELFTRATDFIPNGWESVPYDIQAWVASAPVMLTFHKDDFLLLPYERVVIYPHSFPSPQYPEQFHASEVFEEDAVVLFSSEKLIPGVLQPQQYYNIAMHEYAKVFRIVYPQHDYPDTIDWDIHEAIVGYPQAKLLDYIGMESVEAWPVLASLYFSHPEEMLSKMTATFRQIKTILEG